MSSFLRPVVVCGTDTDVGKTAVSAWLVQGLNARTGNLSRADWTRAATVVGSRPCLIFRTRACSREGYAFQAPVSTPLGSRT